MELPGYTKWIFEICQLLEITSEEGEKLFRDPNWFFCYDDGMTPEAAIKKAKRVGAI